MFRLRPPALSQPQQREHNTQQALVDIVGLIQITQKQAKFKTPGNSSLKQVLAASARFLVFLRCLESSACRTLVQQTEVSGRWKLRSDSGNNQVFPAKESSIFRKLWPETCCHGKKKKIQTEVSYIYHETHAGNNGLFHVSRMFPQFVLKLGSESCVFSDSEPSFMICRKLGSETL